MAPMNAVSAAKSPSRGRDHLLATERPLAQRREWRLVERRNVRVNRCHRLTQCVDKGGGIAAAPDQECDRDADTAHRKIHRRRRPDAAVGADVLDDADDRRSRSRRRPQRAVRGHVERLADARTALEEFACKGCADDGRDLWRVGAICPVELAPGTKRHTERPKVPRRDEGDPDPHRLLAPSAIAAAGVGPRPTHLHSNAKRHGRSGRNRGDARRERPAVARSSTQSAACTSHRAHRPGGDLHGRGVVRAEPGATDHPRRSPARRSHPASTCQSGGRDSRSRCCATG